jgi:hypothetical protein
MYTNHQVAFLFTIPSLELVWLMLAAATATQTVALSTVLDMTMLIILSEHTVLAAMVPVAPLAEHIVVQPMLVVQEPRVV